MIINNSAFCNPFQIQMGESCSLVTHQTVASHFVLIQQDFKSDRVRNLVVEGVSFRIIFWLTTIFKDGQEENTLFKMGHGHFVIFC